ncbi:MAG: hypothetical protein CMI16_16035 [Opitutaceae bacterium]|nr:hypothetical protein [Opitutaceae bacterium]
MGLRAVLDELSRGERQVGALPVGVLADTFTPPTPEQIQDITEQVVENTRKHVESWASGWVPEWTSFWHGDIDKVKGGHTQAQLDYVFHQETFLQQFMEMVVELDLKAKALESLRRNPSSSDPVKLLQELRTDLVKNYITLTKKPELLWKYVNKLEEKLQRVQRDPILKLMWERQRKMVEEWNFEQVQIMKKVEARCREEDSVQWKRVLEATEDAASKSSEGGARVSDQHGTGELPQLTHHRGQAAVDGRPGGNRNEGAEEAGSTDPPVHDSNTNVVRRGTRTVGWVFTTTLSVTTHSMRWVLEMIRLIFGRVWKYSVFLAFFVFLYSQCHDKLGWPALPGLFDWSNMELHSGWSRTIPSQTTQTQVFLTNFSSESTEYTMSITNQDGWDRLRECPDVTLKTQEQISISANQPVTYEDPPYSAPGTNVSNLTLPAPPQRNLLTKAMVRVGDYIVRKGRTESEVQSSVSLRGQQWSLRKMDKLTDAKELVETTWVALFAPMHFTFTKTLSPGVGLRSNDFLQSFYETISSIIQGDVSETPPNKDKKDKKALESRRLAEKMCELGALKGKFENYRIGQKPPENHETDEEWKQLTLIDTHPDETYTLNMLNRQLFNLNGLVEMFDEMSKVTPALSASVEDQTAFQHLINSVTKAWWDRGVPDPVSQVQKALKRHNDNKIMKLNQENLKILYQFRTQLLATNRVAGNTKWWLENILLLRQRGNATSDRVPPDNHIFMLPPIQVHGDKLTHRYTNVGTVRKVVESFTSKISVEALEYLIKVAEGVRVFHRTVLYDHIKILESTLEEYREIVKNIVSEMDTLEKKVKDDKDQQAQLLTVRNLLRRMGDVKTGFVPASDQTREDYDLTNELTSVITTTDGLGATTIADGLLNMTLGLQMLLGIRSELENESAPAAAQIGPPPEGETPAAPGLLQIGPPPEGETPAAPGLLQIGPPPAKNGVAFLVGIRARLRTLCRTPTATAAAAVLVAERRAPLRTLSSGGARP